MLLVDKNAVIYGRVGDRRRGGPHFHPRGGTRLPRWLHASKGRSCSPGSPLCPRRWAAWHSL